MALIAIASDKGAPGVTTAALALAAVWPRPVLLAECDPGGGDLAYRFPASAGGQLDPRRGVLSLAVTARRGMQPNQVWEHVQKLHGGLDVLAGVTNAEQGAGLNQLWGSIGKVLGGLPQADVIADCGRLGADGPVYDLIAEATVAVLVTKAAVGDVIRLRDRAAALSAAVDSRGRRGFGAAVLVVADARKLATALTEVQHVLRQASVPAQVIGGLAHDPRGAALLSGGLVGKVGKTLLIQTARTIAQQLVHELPPRPDMPAGPPLAQRGYAASAPGPQGPQGQQGQQGPPQGRHHAGPPAPPAPAPAVLASAPGAPASGPLPAAPPFAPPPGARHAQAPQILAAPAESQQVDWAGAERLKWRERERQQSGGV